MKKGILFDLDGTLWDSSKQVADSWMLAAKQCQDIKTEITTEAIQSVMGKTMEDIADIILAEIDDRDRRMEILQYFCDVENDYIREHGGELFENFQETFQELKKNYHISIVSNCQKGYIEAFLDYYRLRDYIDDFESYGNTGLPKGDNIKMVVERNQLDQAVYVGDTQGDYESAVSAGIPFIHARMGYGTIQADVPYITELSMIPKAVEAFL